MSRVLEARATLRNRGARALVRAAAARTAYLTFRRLSTWFASRAETVDLPSREILLDPEAEKVLARNEELRDLFRGRKAFVVGTGPSLAKQNLIGLRGEVTIGLNSFWRHQAVGDWSPTVHCLIDPVAFEDTEGTVEHFREVREALPNTRFLVPLRHRAIVRRLDLLPADRTYYIAFHGELSASTLSSIDITRSVPGVICVSYLGIYAALFMGCNPVYLMGLDHDWLSYRGFATHFYAHDSVPEGEVGNTAYYPYERLLQDGVKVWRAYRKLDAFAGERGIEIYNATEGGFLDVFPATRLGDVLNQPDVPVSPVESLV